MYEVKVPSRFEYNIIDKENYGIYPKIDWVSVIFNDCSFYDVLSWIELQNSVIEFSLGQYEVVRGLSTEFVFAYNGVKLSSSDIGYYIDSSKVDLRIFEIPIRKIKLELSGSALDYLRSIDIDIDKVVYTKPFLSEAGSYHFTRVDFAYDFINYCPIFMSEFRRYIDENILPTGRVPCVGARGGYEANYKIGKEFTIYIGSTKSKRLLRCYDKKLQFIDRESGTYIKANPYNNPDSWFRIEWQLRDEAANETILNKFTFVDVLKKLYCTYKFAERKRTATGRAPVLFFEKLLNWDEILLPAIRQNLHLVKVKSLPERIIQWEEQIAEYNNMLYSEIVNPLEVAKKRVKLIDNLYLPQNFRRLNAFVNKLNACKVDLTLNSKLVGIVEYKNRLHYIDLSLGIFPEGYPINL